MSSFISEREALPPRFFLINYALQIGALELVPEGRVLKSGRISPYFFNSGLFKTGQSLNVLARAYIESMREMFGKPDVIFGPAYKGISLAVAIATNLEGDTEVAFNRKEVKDHGEGGLIVGASLRDKKVLIVDDVMTTGTSSGEAVEIIKAQGGTPVGCVIAFDRQERGKESDLSATQEFTKNYGIPVCAAVTLTDLIEFLSQLKNHERFSAAKVSVLPLIEEYKKQYGVSF